MPRPDELKAHGMDFNGDGPSGRDGQ
jgi:hypothetical protein